jgi:zinc protease
MKKRLTVFSLVALAAVFTAMQGQEEKVFPFEYRQVRLENGLKAYLIKAGSPGQISYVTVVRSGSRDEYEPGKSGYAHFFEHMMFRGTARRPDYNGITGEIGAIGNAATANDSTRYYLVASSDCLDRIIDHESDRFMNLEYTEPQFRTEAGAIRGELS